MKYYVTYKQFDSHPKPKIVTKIADNNENLKSYLDIIEYGTLYGGDDLRFELLSIVPCKED